MAMLAAHEHLVRGVVSRFWHLSPDDVSKALEIIKVKKVGEDKLMGFLPAYQGYPPAFFKVYLNETKFANELNGLSVAGSLPSVAGIHVPTMLDVVPECKTILMEKLEYHDKNSGVRRFFVQFLNINWCGLGSWLRSFHDAKVERVDSRDYINRKIDGIRERLGALDVFFVESQRNVIRRILDSNSPYGSDCVQDYVLSHADFCLANIEISCSPQKELFIYDFERSHVAPREYDILYFLTTLEYAGYFPNRPKTYRWIRHEFLNGYHLDLKEDPQTHLLYLAIKLSMISRYGRLTSQSSGLQRAIYSYFQHRGIVSLRNWLENVRFQ